jgi:Right handed beta helix region
MRPDRVRRAAGRETAAVLLFVALAVGLIGARHLALALASGGMPGRSPGAGAGRMASPDVTPRVMAIQRETLDLARAAALTASRGGVTGVARLTPTRSALVLLPRGDPYRVADLLRFPTAATATPGGDVAVHLPIVVLRDAVLAIDSGRTPRLRLDSSPAGFASIVGLGGGIELTGSAARPLEITTADPATGAPDGRLDDGRGFVLNNRGRMDLTYVRAGALGFGPGLASGVAWAGTGYEPARGAVTHSAFVGNRYGAYTFHALDMTWTDDLFTDNEVYGLAQGDFSSRFLVRSNQARRNGRHGFVLARGCNDNLLESNVSEANLGDGFALNDAPLERGSTARSSPVSSGNAVRDSTAASNGGSGADVLGGRETVLVGNHLDGNQFGVRYAATASGRVEGNEIRDNVLAGVRIEATAGEVVLRGNHGHGSWADLAAARTVEQAGNDFGIQRITLTAGAGSGVAAQLTRSARYLRARPALAVWILLLGLPVLSRGLARL